MDVDVILALKIKNVIKHGSYKDFEFKSGLRDREAFTNPRENDANKMAEGKKENTNGAYLLSIFFEGFRSTAKQGVICD